MRYEKHLDRKHEITAKLRVNMGELVSEKTQAH